MGMTLALEQAFKSGLLRLDLSVKASQPASLLSLPLPLSVALALHIDVFEVFVLVFVRLRL